MATFIKELAWRNSANDFDIAQRKILMALSDERWDWRTIGSLRKVVRLPESEFAQALESLMEEGLIRGSVTDDWSRPIFGLVERVGPGAQRRPRRSGR